MSPDRRRLVRTVFQTTLGVAAAMPLLVHTVGLNEQTAGVGVLLGVSAGATRLMALPVVESWLPAWLRKDPPQGGSADG